MAVPTQHEALKAVFCGLVESLENIVPRPAVMCALNAALTFEREVDGLIAAADAEEAS